MSNPDISRLVAQARTSNNAGTFDQTRAICARIFALDAGNVAGMHAYVTATKVGVDDPVFARLNGAVAQSGLPDPVRSQLFFMQAKCLADTGQTEASFKAVIEANRLKQARHDPEATTAAAQDLMAAMRMAHKEQLPVSPPRMVFIIGMPRSGTSVLAAALAGHPQISNLGEQTALGAVMRDAKGAVSPQGFLRGLDATRLQDARAGYLDLVGAARHGTPVLIDKMPENYWLAWAIPMLFPDALILNMTRARLATAWSCFRHDFQEGHAYSYDFAHCLAQYDLCAELTTAWRKTWPRNCMSLALSQFSRQPERGLRAILKRLDLPWDAACLAPATGGTVATLSKWQVRQGITAGISSEWEAYKPLIESRWGDVI